MNVYVIIFDINYLDIDLVFQYRLSLLDNQCKTKTAGRRGSAYNITHVTHARRLNSHRKRISPICGRPHPPARWTDAEHDATCRLGPKAGGGARVVVSRSRDASAWLRARHDPRFAHARAARYVVVVVVLLVVPIGIRIVPSSIASASSSNRYVRARLSSSRRLRAVEGVYKNTYPTRRVIAAHVFKNTRAVAAL